MNSRGGTCMSCLVLLVTIVVFRVCGPIAFPEVKLQDQHLEAFAEKRLDGDISNATASEYVCWSSSGKAPAG